MLLMKNNRMNVNVMCGGSDFITACFSVPLPPCQSTKVEAMLSCTVIILNKKKVSSNITVIIKKNNYLQEMISRSSA